MAKLRKQTLIKAFEHNFKLKMKELDLPFRNLDIYQQAFFTFEFY